MSQRRRFASGLTDRLVGVATGPVLLGRRVTVRPLRSTDFNAWAEVRQRCGEWLTKWEPRRPAGQPDVAESRRAFVQRCEQRDQDRARGLAYGFGIFLAERFVGEINLNTLQRGAAQSAYVGYWMDEAHAGHGYMPEAVVVVARFAFEDLGLHRVQISIVPRNGASRRVVDKLQIRDEGIALRYLEINGVWEDHVRYAMTAEEWMQRRTELAAEWLG